MADAVLPNLIVIGAGKAGTTSLHYYLDQHPDIYMSRVKEPFYFHRSDWNQRIPWYESLFPEPASVRGESSTSYSAYPVLPEVPRRIHELIPEAKLIYVVRDPIDRIVAQWAQHRADGKEQRPLQEALEYALVQGDDPVNPYLCMSCYATQIERYLEHFPLARIHVIDQVELRKDRLATLQSAFEFLGVDDGFNSPAFGQVLNTERDKVRVGLAGARLRDSRIGQLVKDSVPREVRAPVTKPLTRLLYRRVKRPTLPEPLRAQLTSVLRPEVERLRDLTGKRFAEWSL